MEKLLSYTPLMVLAVGGWAVLNGILHDVFVLLQHKKPYDRELLRLLMDGHILITCGLIQMLAYKGLQLHVNWAFAMAAVACLSLLIYCGMIFPFLKSIGTMALNTVALVMIADNYFKTI